MKRGIWMGIALLCAATSQAQSGFDLILSKEGKIVALPKEKQYELRMPKLSYQNVTPKGAREVDIKLRQFTPDIPSIHLPEERPMDMTIASSAYQPFYNVYTPMLRRVSPLALDFQETYTQRVSDNIDVIASGAQASWIGLGGITVLNTGVSWHNDRWMLYGGGFGGRYATPFDGVPGYFGGFNAQAAYRITDQLTIRAWGQYATYKNNQSKWKEKASKNPFMVQDPRYYHTMMGGALEFKFNENIGVGAGVNYEYNPLRRKMERQILVYPLFH